MTYVSLGVYLLRAVDFNVPSNLFRVTFDETAETYRSMPTCFIPKISPHLSHLGQTIVDFEISRVPQASQRCRFTHMPFDTLLSGSFSRLETPGRSQRNAWATRESKRQRKIT
eukprot:2290349-Pyramimonas_sp.AAC.1